MEENAVKLWFNGCTSIFPLLHANNPETKASRTNPNFFLIRKTPFTEVSLSPQTRSCGITRCLRKAPSNHATLVTAEAFHEQSSRTSLIERLQVKGSCPLRLLRDDGDWSEDGFWVVVEFLRHASRSHQILRVLFLLASSSVSFSVAGPWVGKYLCC